MQYFVTQNGAFVPPNERFEDSLVFALNALKILSIRIICVSKAAFADIFVMDS